MTLHSSAQDSTAVRILFLSSLAQLDLLAHWKDRTLLLKKRARSVPLPLVGWTTASALVRIASSRRQGPWSLLSIPFVLATDGDGDT
jgi:hypothetical protein